MKNTIIINIFFAAVLVLIAQNARAQTQIGGTWYANGRADQVCTITQNGNNLVFIKGNGRSNGYFTNASALFATDWNTAATLTVGATGILWDNQIWTRNPYSGYVSLQGNWGTAAQPQEQYLIEQDNTGLLITFQGKKVLGYFTSGTMITVPEWNNAIANVSADGATLSWSNQVWTKKTTNTPTIPPTTSTNGNQGTTQKLCRKELSVFYYAAQALGSAWGRMGTESPMLSAEAVAACDAHLSLLDATLGVIQCIVFDRGRIRNLRGRLSSTSTQQLVVEIESIIKDLQVVIQNLRLSCDNNVSLSSLYVGGIHLGAAQAWASSRQCMPTPMPVAIQTVIQNHLTTASTALTPYAACIPNFDFSGFGRVMLGSLNSILPHTQIVGMETQLLWAIALSDCCCTCSPGQNATPTTTSACDDECVRYCKSIGKQYGRFNGKTPCLLGVVSGGTSNGCDCW